ncbi:hypothetical protein OGATHE_006099 [Ogataea polymorpha]|uniref:Uncharacterized protein n=1 Tax=Ogataea polymorpha TaxID=460523 RepID=A0A9P8NTF1_9ASCO|nr:hypothetical protein OGATHE_006099 [Ogataea polymorpha]
MSLRKSSRASNEPSVEAWTVTPLPEESTESSSPVKSSITSSMSSSSSSSSPTTSSLEPATAFSRSLAAIFTPKAAFTSLHNRNVSGQVVVLEVELRVQSLFGQCNLDGRVSGLKFLLHGSGLLGKRVTERVVRNSLPVVESVDLVQCHHKRSFPVSQKPDGLQSLLFQTMHDVNHQNGNVTQRGTSGSQVCERLVTWGIDDQQTWNLVNHLLVWSHDSSFLLDGLHREVCGTDLLRNTTSLASLNVSLSNLVQKLGFTGIDVTQNTADRRTQI